MTLPQALKVLRTAGYPPDAYRWLNSRRLLAFAQRVKRERMKKG